MKFFAGIAFAAMASMASSAVIKRATPLDVKLEAADHAVTASITNTGTDALNLLSVGTLLDENEVEKVNVFSGDSKVPFAGMHILPAPNALQETSFRLLSPGETIKVTVDPSELHDLSEGGAFDAVAQGHIPLADLGTTTLNGQTVSYKSNTLTISVDALHARSARASFVAKHKRAAIAGDCQGDQLGAVQAALNECVRVASNAANNARGGDAGKFAEFFRTEDSNTRNNAADRFNAIAANCGSGQGPPEVSCVDTRGPCSQGAGAYAVGDLVVWCPYWFDSIPLVSGTCHAQDKTNLVIHEFTHVASIFPPSTEDHAYFYEGIIGLSPAEAINNADTFALYASAVDIGC